MTVSQKVTILFLNFARFLFPALVEWSKRKRRIEMRFALLLTVLVQDTTISRANDFSPCTNNLVPALGISAPRSWKHILLALFSLLFSDFYFPTRAWNSHTPPLFLFFSLKVLLGSRLGNFLLPTRLDAEVFTAISKRATAGECDRLRKWYHQEEKEPSGGFVLQTQYLWVTNERDDGKCGPHVCGRNGTGNV